MAKLASSSFALDFLRRLLCARTAGGDVVTQREAPGLLTVPEPEGRSPCIVARLMGLDAMPSEADAPRAQPLRRSRSAGEGGRSPCGLTQAAPAKVRPSASLREKPAYLRAENDMFLLLSFSPEEQETTKKAGDGEEAERRHREDGSGRQRRGRRRRRKLRFGDGDDDEAGEEESLGRRECSGQLGSSPVSVLEAREVQEESSTTTTTTTSSSLEDAEPCSATSAEGAHFALEQQNSTKNLPSNFVQLDDMSPTTSPVHASRCSNGDRRNRPRVVHRSEVSTPDVTGIWQPVCRLVEEGIKNMEWLTRDGASLIGEMDSEILDQLVCEATVELVQLSSDASPFRHAPKLFSQDEQSEVHPRPRNIQAGQVLGASEYISRDCQWKSPSNWALRSEIGSTLS
ncbi:hypothetical protein QOZ80_5AG0406530 [Eleusine coracana subsp. coracana]|nr:hypothetical protein QOZ80_5AG0406530 [Eleusine coracana subsp. coracana]